jgi:CubicO group peptidase (beta-lactamase class C family)
MQRLILAGLCWALACSGALARDAAPSASRNTTAPAVAARDAEFFLDGVITQMLDTEAVAGATIAVVEDGRLLFSKGYGFSDVDAGRRAEAGTTRFRIASVTKLFTWTAVMQQVEQGKLDLDVDINQYLDFRVPATYRQPITLRHLMSHTAGFEDKLFGLATRQAVRTDLTLGRALKEGLPERIAPPGRQIAYSNYGTALAGYIVERVAQEPFDAYVTRNIFVPLGMTRTTFRQTTGANLPPDLSQSYRFVDGGLAPVPVEHIYIYPAGAITSTADDMAKFMLAHLQDGRLGTARILRPETARQMRRPLARNARGIEGMAHGFYEVNIDGRRLLAHGGKIAGFTSLLIIAPDTGTGIFVSMNTLGRVMTVEQVARAYMRRFHPGPAPRPAPIRIASDDVAAFLGTYRPNIVNRSSLERIGSAFAAVHVAKNENGGIVVAIGRDVSRWIPAGEDRFIRAEGAELRDQLVFKRDHRGRVVSFAIGWRPYVVFDRIPAAETPVALWTMIGIGVTGALVILVTTLIALFRRKRTAPARTVRIALALAAIAAVGVLASSALIAVGVMSFATLPAATPAPLSIAKLVAFVALLSAVAAILLQFAARWNKSTSTRSILILFLASAATLPFFAALHSLNWLRW